MQECKIKSLNNKFILCLYEGNAEKEILDMLIDNDKLIFNKKDLIDHDFHVRISGKKIGQKYLNYAFDKPVAIIRVIDSKKENFLLSQPYKDLYKEIYTCRTCPEIEILLIMYHGDEALFQSQLSKEGLRACQFCKKHYNYSKTRDKMYFTNNFTIEELLDLLKRYALRHSNEYTIYSLVKE